MKRQFLSTILLQLVLLACAAGVSASEVRKLSNTVCFVRFQDEEADVFERQQSFYNQLFNAPEENANSVFAYFRAASYGQLEWKSSFFPTAIDGSTIVSYQAQHERNYYREQSSIATSGYTDATQAAAREQALIKEIAAYLNANLPEGTVVDEDGDGFVDNLCIVLSGKSEISSRHLLWPHRSDLALPEEMAVRINGARLVGYLLVFDQANGYSSNFDWLTLNTGVLCHEMSHSLGTYDLYHVSGSLNPVGVWDLMSDNQMRAQQMTAYTKWRYCKWLTEIPEITASGTYTLNPISSPTAENIAFKVQPDKKKAEYFVMEYRRKTGYDSNLPGEGLIIYRVNPDYSRGNTGYNGTTRFDEQYILRPGGSTTADGNISKAAIAQGNDYSSLGGTAGSMGLPYYQDGTTAPFIITDVSAPGETITFTLTLKEPTPGPDPEDITEPRPTGAIIYETFEDGTLPEGWTVQGTGYREWHCEPAGKTYTAYEGKYTATVYSAWDDIHQDEMLISPVFSNGTALRFWSRSTASGSTPRDPQPYIVEVSSDGGNTWQQIFSLPQDQEKTLSNKWNLVTLDLTPYQSETMQVRFHCYDTNQNGLSYPWQLDNVGIIGQTSGISTITSPVLNGSTVKYLDANRRITIRKGAVKYNVLGQKK